MTLSSMYDSEMIQDNCSAGFNNICAHFVNVSLENQCLSLQTKLLRV